MSRFALRFPVELVNVWGRPVVTALYTLPASVSSPQRALFLCRLLSLVLVLATGGLTYAIARGQGYRRAELAFLFLLAQPLLFLESMSVLTEIPFAFLAGAAFLAYQKRRFLLMTLLASLLPLTRPEGFGFLLLAGFALLAHRKWVWLLLLPLPLALWNHAGWVLFGRSGPWWRWLIDHWPYAAESLYHPGPIWHFLVRLPVIASPLIFPAMGIGVCLGLRPLWRIALARRNTPEATQSPGERTWMIRRIYLPNQTVCELLIVLLPLGVLIIHSLLYWLGKMASNGEMRYLLIVSPFWALLAARGWNWTFERLNWRRPVLWGALAALAPLLAQGAYPVVPFKLSPDWEMARCLAEWRRTAPLARQYPNLMAAHPALWYFMDRSPIGPDTYPWSRERIEHPPRRTMLIWDSVYGYYNSDQKRSVTLEELRRAGWRENADTTRACRAECQRVLRPDQWPYIGQWHVLLSPE